MRNGYDISTELRLTLVPDVQARSQLKDLTTKLLNVPVRLRLPAKTTKSERSLKCLFKRFSNSFICSFSTVFDGQLVAQGIQFVEVELAEISERSDDNAEYALSNSNQTVISMQSSLTVVLFASLSSHCTL